MIGGRSGPAAPGPAVGPAIAMHDLLEAVDERAALLVVQAASRRATSFSIACWT